MTNSMSEPIPKKLRQVKAFAETTIPLWPSSTWVPEKENFIGEKTRSLKLELSAEPGASMGKNATESFKMFRSGNPEEQTLWRRDFNEVCVGQDAQTGSGYIRVVHQLLSYEPLKEFERMLATFPVQTQANCNLALDVVALLVFPTNACAKQKKHIRQGLWKPKALTVRKVCTRISKLNAQLTSFPFQTGLLPEDEMKSAFIDLCLPDWQQEFLKTGTNECSSSWDETLSKAEAMEQAQNAIAATTKRTKESAKREKLRPILHLKRLQRRKQSLLSAASCMAAVRITTQISVKFSMLSSKESNKTGTPYPFPANNKPIPTINNQQEANQHFLFDQIAASMTRKNAMEDAKTHRASQIENDSNAMQIEFDAGEQIDKMKKWNYLLTVCKENSPSRKRKNEWMN
jgi:hypothetical protein